MTHEIDRRAFGTVAATAALGIVAAQRNAQAQAGHAGASHAAAPPRTLLATPAEHAIVPLPFAPASLAGLSERLITSHHTNNYASAVRKLNEVRQQLASADPAQSGPYWSLYGSLRSAELAAMNSALLHELYFANLTAGQNAPAAFTQVINQRFGSMERFVAQFRGAARAASGWIVLVMDPSSRTLDIVSTEGHAFGAWSAVPLLVLDVFEHAYAIDFGADKNAYFEAFWRNVAWNEVHNRTSVAINRL